MPKVVTFGEVMLRLSPEGQGRFTQARKFNALYAGSEANVAASLSCMGIPSTHVSCFPDSDLGKAAAMELNQYGVLTDHVAYKDGRMGVYFIEHGASLRSPKIIYDRFDSAFANLERNAFDWDKILDGAEWFHWSGITPAISQSAADVCLDAIIACRKKGVKVSGDINYRRNLWQYGKTAKQIMPGLIEPCDFIVAGVTDIENCLGISGDKFEDACEKMVKKYPSIRKVATTNRVTINSSHQQLKGILWNGKETLESREHDLHPIIDRVGAGDAFMAGLIFGNLKKMSDQQTIDFATAAGALKHTIEGDVNVSTVGEIEAVVKGENVGKLLR
jgi:2-dehydro-3-deoxygluconokinase